MNTTTTQDDIRRPQWILGIAAAAAASVFGVGAYTVLADDDPAATTTASTSSMTLSLPGGEVMRSCVPYSVEILAQMPTAFSGKAVEVQENSVLLEVDRWYRGGDTDTVELATRDGELISLSDVVEFAQGERYLVTASGDGTVTSCGFTSEWNANGAADFERAFVK